MLHSHVGTIFSEDKLHNSICPPETDKSPKDSMWQGDKKRGWGWEVKYAIFLPWEMYLSKYNCMSWVTPRVISWGTLQQLDASFEHLTVEIKHTMNNDYKQSVQRFIHSAKTSKKNIQFTHTHTQPKIMKIQ